jgi:hypothetical protein
MKYKALFIIFALFFFISAAYHLVAVFVSVNESPVWRNLLFVGINAFTGYFLLKRPRWFIWFFILLMFQQLYSHGSDLINAWNSQHRIDWMSLMVILVMPAIYIFLLIDRTAKQN